MQGLTEEHFIVKWVPCLNIFIIIIRSSSSGFIIIAIIIIIIIIIKLSLVSFQAIIHSFSFQEM